jgi:hypothetical protein
MAELLSMSPNILHLRQRKARSMAGSCISIPNRLFLFRCLLPGNGRLESGTGRKSRYRGCRDLELLARLRIASHARGTLRRLEGTEADQGHGVAFGYRFRDGGGDGIEGGAGGGFAEFGFGGYDVDELICS